MAWVWILLGSGFGAGIVAGLFGIGGGTLLVPLLVKWGHTPIQAIATSTLAIVIISSAGTVQNYRRGYVHWSKVIPLALPALLTAQLGVYGARVLPDRLLLATFGALLMTNIFLGRLKRRLTPSPGDRPPKSVSDPAIAPVGRPWLWRLLTGGSGGMLAGLFGVGGGIVLVPLQVMFLRENIKTAIQTSLGVIVLTSLAACVGHGLGGNVLWVEGLGLGLGGAAGALVSGRYLPKLPDRLVAASFSGLLLVLALSMFYQALVWPPTP